MELNEFVNKVAEMRQAQKQYFNARKTKKDKLTVGKALIRRIIWEVAVDTAIREFRIRQAEKVIMELSKRMHQRKENEV